MCFKKRNAHKNGHLIFLECPKNFVEEKLNKINWLANTLNFYSNV
jgi:hypothetical protein